MITIHKYQFDLASRVEIKMPQGAKVLSIQVQNGAPTVWAMVVTEAAFEIRVFRIYGTGSALDTFAIAGNHLATIQHQGYVWHIFE